MPTIKSVGRKDRNFRQLIDYLHRDDGGEEATFTYLHNIQTDSPDDRGAIEEAFVKNSVHHRKRKNGIGQYHEVISFAPEDADYLRQHPEALEDIARVYLELRAPHAVAIAKPHTDKEHYHIHLMISPNNLESSRNIRLSKQEFSALRRTMEEYQLAYYPELKHSYVHSRDKYKYEAKRLAQEEALSRSHQSQQMEQRNAPQTVVEWCTNIVQNALSFVTNETDLRVELQKMDMTPYEYRNRLNGIIYQEKKYRFRRLLKKESEAMKKVEILNAERRIKQRKQQHERNVLDGL